MNRVNILRNIPAIDKLQRHNRFQSLLKKSRLPVVLLTDWLKLIIDELRNEVEQRERLEILKEEAKLLAYIFDQLDEMIFQFQNRNYLERVINATGIVIHTNLGRSRLHKEAITHIADVAEAYSTLEYDINKGKRGSRHSIVEQSITQLTGAEAALVVNNNASAVYFILKALAEEKEVIVSRGELVEIGGSFRISEIMELSDAHLVEIGTTNKTNLSDYEKAITENTSMILKVHKSNFDIIGFTEEVKTEHLVELAKEKEIILYEDLGSGTLFDFAMKGIGKEPTVQEQVEKGIDIISFSGDKLLGGPQAGVIVGKKKYIDRLKKHQLARVLRVDKFTLAALETTLKLYLANRAEEIPSIRDVLQKKETVQVRINKFFKKTTDKLSNYTFKIKTGVSKVGGGTMPMVDLPTYVVEVAHQCLSGKDLAKQLRHYSTPIIVKIQEEKVQLDFRTVTDEELPIVIEALETIGTNV